MGEEYNPAKPIYMQLTERINWVASNRYRLFGKRETCTVPSAEIRKRFMDEKNPDELL